VSNAEQVTNAKVQKLTSNEDTILLPHCVSSVTWKAWSKSREWLTADNRKIYCSVCCETYKAGFNTMTASVGSKKKFNFINGVTTDHLEKSKDKQRRQLLKKIDKHGKSQTHAASVQIKQQALRSELEGVIGVDD